MPSKYLWNEGANGVNESVIKRWNIVINGNTVNQAETWQR